MGFSEILINKKAIVFREISLSTKTAGVNAGFLLHVYG